MQFIFKIIHLTLITFLVFSPLLISQPDNNYFFSDLLDHPTNSKLSIYKSSESRLQFVTDNCPFQIPPGSKEGIDIICGHVEVPSSYSDPQGPTISLAVAIIKSLVNEPKPDPVFFAQGGPGGSTLKTYVSPLLSSENRLRADRDLVLFDQRGTLYSRPTLYCDEYDKYVIENLNTDFPDEVYQSLRMDAMGACRNRLLASGINLSDFDSVENAKDIESLRIALGYEKINLYGVSYGTLLAQHFMSIYPESLRSVILDGVVPADRNAFLDNITNMDRAFRKLFESCSGDLNCQKYFPELETSFYKLVDQLDKNPVQIFLTDPDDGVKYPAMMDGDSFIGSVFQMLYVSSLIPTLPGMIYLAGEGNFSMLERILSIFIFDRSISYGMYYSVWCSEFSKINPHDIQVNGVHPRIIKYLENDIDYFLETCNLWEVEPLQPDKSPVTSTIPTLLLSGEYDPVTPPENAEKVAAFLSLSYSISFPSGAHGQALDNPCSDQIMLSFLEDPHNKPDTTCLAEISQVNFFTKNNVVFIPTILKLLNLEGNTITEFFILIISQLILLSSLIFFPLAWVLRITSSKPKSQPSLVSVLPNNNYQGGESSYRENQIISIDQKSTSTIHQSWVIRRASWIVITNTVLQIFFISAVIILLFQMISENDNRLFFGVAGDGRMFFTLPLLSILTSFTMLFISATSWLKSNWSLGKRFYFGALTIATLASLAIFYRWELLFAFFS